LPRRDAASKGTISDFPKEEYFCVHDWTADSALNWLANFDFWRRRLGQDFLSGTIPQHASRCPSGKSAE
jgi:hypothetical protein